MRTGPSNPIALSAHSFASQRRKGTPLLAGLLTIATATLAAASDRALSLVTLADTDTADGLTVAKEGLHPDTASRGLAGIVLLTDMPTAKDAPAGTTGYVSELRPLGGDLSDMYPGDLQGVHHSAVYNDLQLPDFQSTFHSAHHALWPVPAQSATAPIWLSRPVLSSH